MSFGEGVVSYIILLIVIIISYCFILMRQVLYGKWYKISPVWKWYDEFKKIKKISETSEDFIVRKKCKKIFYGLYISGGLLLLAVIINFSQA